MKAYPNLDRILSQSGSSGKKQKLNPVLKTERIEYTEEEFDNRYTLDDSVQSKAFSDPGKLEPYGSDLEVLTRIHKATPMRVWTMIETDEGLALIQGLHMVDRIYYVITKEPARSEHERYKMDDL